MILKYLHSIFKKTIRTRDLDIIDPERDLNRQILKVARHSDLNGNYDLDGVSFDGREISVSGKSKFGSKPLH